MSEQAQYRIQFYRQWVGDTGIPDEPATGLLDHVKAVAQVRLEAHALGRAGIRKPRIARVLEQDTRDMVAQFRLTSSGPVEIGAGRDGKPPKMRSEEGPRLRLVE